MAKQVLMTYSVLDGVYQNPSLRYARGKQDALSSTPTVGTIDNPSDTGVPLLPTDPDPKMFSFAYKGEARMLLSKVVSPVSGTAPYTTWTLLAAPNPAYGAWSTLAKDIVLRYPGTNGSPVATNSYGVAQVGNWLYIVDYDAQKIYTLGVNELNGLPEGATYTLTQAPLDMSPGTTANLPATAMGQAIIALTDGSGNPFIFALYIDFDSSTFAHQPGYLVRLTVNPSTGALTYDTKTATGLNPQEIIPLGRTGNVIFIAVPCVGGSQQAGTNNGTASVIQTVPAFAAWPGTAPIRLTGTTGSTFDIFNIAAPSRADDSGVVYILTYDYNATYTGTNWTLYRTTVSALLSLSFNTPIDPLPAGFTKVDSGSGTPGYFWNILFENGDAAENDRLWFFEGAALLVNPALAYAKSPQTGVANRFFDVGDAAGQIGGENVDWADLTIETLRQAAAGVSLKRNVRAQKAPATKAEGEEEK